MAKSSVVSVEEKKPAAQQPAVSNPAPRQTGSTVVSKKLYDRNPATTANIPSMQNTGSNVVTTRQPRVPVTQVMNTGLKKSFDVELKQPDVKWYSGEQPTIREAYQRLAVIHKTDPNRAAEAYGLLQNMKKDPTSSFYSPYEQPTNRAVSELAKYGIDTSKIDDDFFRRNEWLKQYYDPSNYTNNPSAPTKKSSDLERAAYWYYQLELAREDTDAADQEWADLQKEIAYLASSDMNLSDKQIADRINKEIVSGGKYKTLAKLDDGRQRGAPVELNRATGYSQDAIYGAIWAARNGGSTGDPEQDLMNYVRFIGNHWEDNPDLAAKLDSGNKDTYAPYTVGMTNMDEEGAYFGRRYFDQKWIDENRSRYLGSGNEKDAKMFNNVQKAEKYTQTLEKERDEMYKRIDSWVKITQDADTILAWLKDDDDKEFQNLFDLDESKDYGEYGLKKTTRNVKYDWKDVEAYVREQCGKLKQSTETVVEDAVTPTQPVGEPEDTARPRRNAWLEYGEASLNAFWNYLFPSAKSPSGNRPEPTPTPGAVTGAMGTNALTPTAIPGVNLGAAGAMGTSAPSATPRPDADVDATGAMGTNALTINPKPDDPIGQYGEGNIDLYNRAVVVNPDGSFSTERSISIGVDDNVVLIPTVIDGKVVSDEAAIQHYKATGQYLGKFANEKEADDYANALHERQEELYSRLADYAVTNNQPVITPTPVSAAGASEGARVNPESTTAPDALGSALQPVGTGAAAGAPEVAVNPEAVSTPQTTNAPPVLNISPKAIATPGIKTPGSTPSPEATPAPVLSETEKAIESQKIANLDAVAPTILGKGTDGEKTVLETGKTGLFDWATDQLINNTRDPAEWLDTNATRNLVSSYMDQANMISEYEKHQKNRDDAAKELDGITDRWEELSTRQATTDAIGNMEEAEFRNLQALKETGDWNEIIAAFGENGAYYGQDSARSAMLEDLYYQVTSVNALALNDEEYAESMEQANLWWDYLENPSDTSGFDFLTPEETAELDELTERKSNLEATLEEEDSYLSDEENLYNMSRTEKNRLTEAYVTSAVMGNGDLSLLAGLDDVYTAANIELPGFRTSDLLDYNVDNGSISQAEATQYATSMAIKDKDEAGRLINELAQLDSLGVKIPDDMREAVERRIEYLRDDVLVLSYMSQDGTEEFEDAALIGQEMAAAGEYGRVAKAVATGKLDQDFYGFSVTSMFHATRKNDILESTINAMSPQEKKRYFATLDQAGEEAAQRYLDLLMDEKFGTLDDRRMAAQQEKWSEFASRNFFTGALSYGVSFFNNVLSGPVALGYEIGQTLQGKGINVNAPAFDWKLYTATTRNAVKGDLVEALGGSGSTLGKVGGFIFDAGTKAVDYKIASTMVGNLFKALFTGGRMVAAGIPLNALNEGSGFFVESVDIPKAINWAIKTTKGAEIAKGIGTAFDMAMDSASTTWRNAVLYNNATPEEAAGLAAVTLVSDTLAYSVTARGMDKILGSVEGTGALKGYVTDLFRNATGRGVSAGFVTALDQAAEKAILQEKSTYAQAVSQYKDIVGSEKVAKQLADQDAWNNILRSTGQGALMGALYTTGNYVGKFAGNVINNRRADRPVSAEGTVTDASEGLPEAATGLTAGNVRLYGEASGETGMTPVNPTGIITPGGVSSGPVPVSESTVPAAIQRQDQEAMARIKANEQAADNAMKQFQKDMATLSGITGTTSPTGAAVSITAALGGTTINGSKAASQAIVGTFAEGDTQLAAMGLEKILLGTDVDPMIVKLSVVQAALVDGAGQNALKGLFSAIKSGAQITKEQVNSVISGVFSDLQANPTEFQNKLNAAIKASRVANRTMEILQNGEAGKSIKAAQQAVGRAKDGAKIANDNKKQAEAGVKAAGEAVGVAVNEQLNGDATDASLIAPVEQAAEQLEGAITNLQQQDQAVQAAEKNVEEAEQAKSEVESEKLTEVRVQAEAEVSQEIAQEEAEAAAAAEADAQAELDTALANYPPTSSFNGVVEVSGMDGSTYKVTGLYAQAADGSWVYTTTDGYVTDNQLDWGSVSDTSLLDMALDNWKPSKNPQNQPVVWFPKSIEALNPEDGTHMSVIGLAGEMTWEGYTSPIVMDINGNLYNADELTYADTEESHGINEVYGAYNHSSNLPQISEADVISFDDSEPELEETGSIPEEDGDFATLNGVSYLKSPEIMTVTDSTGDELDLVGMTVSFGGDIMAVDDQGYLWPFGEFSDFSPEATQWILSNADKLGEDNFDHGISMVADVNTIQSLKTFFQSSGQSAESTGTTSVEPVFDEINGTQYLKAPNTASLKTDIGDYKGLGITIWSNGKLVFVDDYGAPLPMHWVKQADDPSFIQWALNNLSVLEGDNSTNGIYNTLDPNQVESYKNILNQILSQSNSTPGSVSGQSIPAAGESVDHGQPVYPVFEEIGGTHAMKAPTPATVTFRDGESTKVVGVSVSDSGNFFVVNEDGLMVDLSRMKSVDNPEFFQWALDNLDVLKESHPDEGIPGALSQAQYDTEKANLENVLSQSQPSASNPPAFETIGYSTGLRAPKSTEIVDDNGLTYTAVGMTSGFSGFCILDKDGFIIPISDIQTVADPTFFQWALNNLDILKEDHSDAGVPALNQSQYDAAKTSIYGILNPANPVSAAPVDEYSEGKVNPKTGDPLKNWQDPKYHGKVSGTVKKVNPKTKAFKKFFEQNAPEALPYVTNPDGTPRFYYRGYGGYGDTLYTIHQSKPVTGPDGKPMYLNFYMDKISTASTYAHTSRITNLRWAKNWETAKAAMKDIGYDLIEAPGPNGQMGYQVVTSYGSPAHTSGANHAKTWFAENELKRFRDTYGGELSSKGIHVGYIACRKPLIIDCHGSNYSSVYAGPNGVTAPDGDVYTGTHKTRRWAEWAFQHGFDSVIFANVKDNASGGGEVGTEIVTSQSGMFKSAFNSGKWNSNDPNIQAMKVPSGKPAKVGKEPSAELTTLQHLIRTGTPVEEMSFEERKAMADAMQTLPEVVEAKKKTPAKPDTLPWDRQSAIRKFSTGKDTSVESLQKAGVPENTIQLLENGADYITAIESLFTPEDVKEQRRVRDIMAYERGSAAFDEKGKASYNGEVSQDRQLHIVVGLPNSGKSTLVDPISYTFKSRVLDSDDAKKLHRDYAGGANSSPLHNESRFITDQAAAIMMANGDNVVLPVVGHSYSSVKRQIEGFKDAGYTVHLHSVQLPWGEALARGLGRTFETGRLLDFYYLTGTDTTGLSPKKINDTFDKLVQEGLVDGYAVWDNNVERGKPAVPIRYSGEDEIALIGGAFGGGRVDGRGPDDSPGGNAGAGTTPDVDALRMRNRTPTQNQAARVKAKLKSPQTIAETLVNDLGFGNYMGSNRFGSVKARGFWDNHAKYVAVHSRELGNYMVTMHEAGHGVADKLGMTGTQLMVYNLIQSNPGFAQAYHPDQLPGEAYAEFFWRYLESEDSARAFAGDAYYDDFERRLAANPEINRAVQEAKNHLRQWAAASAMDRAASMIKHDQSGERGNWMRRVTDGLKDVLEFVQKGIVDQSAAAAPVDKMARQLNGGKKLDLKHSVRANALMSNHSQKQAVAILTDSLTDAEHTIIGDGLGKRFSDVGFKGTEQDIQDLELYSLAKHAVGRAEQRKTVFGENFTDQDVQNIISSFENDPSKKHIVDAQKVWQGFRKEFLQAWMVDTGFWTQEFFDHLNNMYPDYVPTYRVKGGKNGIGARISGANRKKYMLHTATGSSEDIYSPFYSFIGMVDQIVGMVNTNQAALAFDRLYQENEGMGIFGRQIFDDGKGGFVPEDTGELNARQAQVEAILNGHITDDLMQDVLEVLKSQPGMNNASAPGSLLTVQRPDGTVVHYEMSDPYLYRLLAGVQSSAGIQGLQLVGNLTRMMSMLTTGSNPLFAARNAVRDYQTSVNYGTWASNYLTGLPKWLKTFVDVWRGDEIDREYRALGGGGWTYIEQNNPKSMGEITESMFGADRSNVGKTAKWLGKRLWDFITFDRLNEVIEQTSRQVEYRYGKHDRTTPEGRQEAFQASQDVTVDFSRSGNSALASVLKKVIPFFNASTQGVNRTARQFTGEERDRVGTRFAKTIINTALTSALAAGLIAKFCDDEDKEEFSGMLSEGIKANHLIIPNPLANKDGSNGQPPFLRIPLAQDPLSYIVHNMVTNAMWYGTEDETAISLAATADVILDNLNPLGSGTVIQPIIDASHNRTWYGGSIVRTSQLDWTDKASQYNEDTPTLFRNLGRLLNTSPEVVEYLATQYSGFLGAVLIPALTIDDNGEIGGADAILQSIVKKWTADPLTSNDVTKYFYNTASTLETIKGEAKADRPQGLLAYNLTQDQVNQAYTEAEEMLKTNGIIGATKKVITDAYAKIDQINSNSTLTDGEKYKLTSEVKLDMLKQVMAANEQLQAYEHKYLKGGSLVDRLFTSWHEGKYAHVPTTEEQMPQIFRDDMDSTSNNYMKYSKEIYDATGNANVLPHPEQTITISNTKYTIPDDEWDEYLQIYKNAYEKHVNKKLAKWDIMTDDQKKAVFSGNGSAHSAGMKAIREEYSRRNNLR